MEHVLSQRQLIISGFPFSEYPFCEKEGVVDATLEEKAWGKSMNLVCFVLTDDGEQICFSTFQNQDDYMGFHNVPNGARIRLYFERGKRSARVKLAKWEHIPNKDLTAP